MPNFKSKPHEIEAFQFMGRKTIAPEWFIDHVRVGEASVTMNAKENHITIYGNNQEEKAYPEHWVCRASHGKIYVLDDKSFKESYTEIK